ncbi:LysR family transcriptional regulator [Pediococcus siamensis]|uniref:LysR family transcriptional regulator n=1 Tax=Pediococcus siamensis TaxID=381829 RepID=UPI0039A11903
MRLRQLSYFLNVAETQNITRSARNLHIAQPSLSRSIRELETELGIPLFSRSGHALVLNPAGKRFAVQVQAALHLLDDAVVDMHQFATKQAAQITLQFKSSTALLPELVSYIYQAVPNVKVQLVQRGMATGQPANYDFELVTQPVAGNLNTHLLHEELLLAIQATAPKAQGTSITLSEVRTLPLIFTEASPLREQIERTLQQDGTSVHPTFVTGDHKTLNGLIRNGLGVGFEPQYSWPSMDEAGIKRLHLAPDPLTRDIYLSAPPRTFELPYRKTVAKVIKKYFDQLQH